MRYLFLFLLLITVLLPETASAQLVTCDGPECNWCSFVEMVNLVIQWLFGFLVIVSVLLLAIAGLRMVTSAGNQAAVGEAKKMFTNVIIGFIIVFAAWVLVDTILKSLAGDNLNVGKIWDPVDCGEMFAGKDRSATYITPDFYSPESDDEYNVGLGLPGGVYSKSGSYTDLTGCSGSACSSLSTPCKNGCSVDAGLVDAINNMHSQAGVSGAWVSESMPPSTDKHKASCHYNGTCIDYSKPGGMSSDEVKNVITAARSNGLRPVYEVATQSQKDSLVRDGVPKESILVLGSHITAPHFSIYGN